MSQPQHLRSDYRHFQPITTRWHDNDVYGHVNNVVYGFFDSAVNTYLIEVGGLDIHDGEVVGFVVSSSCDYFASIAFPDRIEVGLRVGKLGNSSVQYELAIFKAGEDEACAAGRFVHVFVDRTSNRPVPIPERLRAAWRNSSSRIDRGVGKTAPGLEPGLRFIPMSGSRAGFSPDRPRTAGMATSAGALTGRSTLIGLLPAECAANPLRFH